MTRAQLFACAGPACLALIATTPAFAQTGPRPLTNGRFLSWPGKTLPADPAEAVPTSEDAVSAPLPPPARPAERRMADAEAGWREAPPVERITLPARAAATSESRYGPRRIEAARVEPPVREEPRVNARTVAAVPARSFPEPARAPLTPAEAAPGGWIVLPSRSAQAAASAMDGQAPLKPLFRPKPVEAPRIETAHLAAPPQAAPARNISPPPIKAAEAVKAPQPAPVREAEVRPAVREQTPLKPALAPVEAAEAAHVEAAKPTLAAKPAPAAKLADNASPPASAAATPRVPLLMVPPSHPWNTRFPSAADPQPVQTASADKPHKAKPVKTTKAEPAKETSRPVQMAQAVEAPRPLPVSSNRPGVHFYSVHRDFGIAPTPPPIPPQFFGSTADLSVPDGPELPPSQVNGKGAAAARNRALSDNASSDN